MHLNVHVLVFLDKITKCFDPCNTIHCKKSDKELHAAGGSMEGFVTELYNVMYHMNIAKVNLQLGGWCLSAWYKLGSYHRSV